ncbi:MAG: hypothetical protein NUV76_13200, partial [Candidatus Kuenenia sp.]|nr:hypothetical protein [Candidatus Kuenenia sp.]
DYISQQSRNQKELNHKGHKGYITQRTQRKTYKKGNHRLHRLRRELRRTIAQIKKIVTGLQLTNFAIKYFAKNAKKLLIKIIRGHFPYCLLDLVGKIRKVSLYFYLMVGWIKALSFMPNPPK